MRSAGCRAAAAAVVNLGQQPQSRTPRQEGLTDFIFGRNKQPRKISNGIAKSCSMKINELGQKCWQLGRDLNWFLGLVARLAHTKPQIVLRALRDGPEGRGR